MSLSRTLPTVDPVKAVLNVEYILISNGSVDASSDFGTASIDVPSRLPPGPYYAKYTNGTISVYPAYRLFSDEFASFMTGVYPLPNGTYTTANLYDPLSAPSIPVPSKLYTSLLPKSEYPLAGYRFALKDIFDLNGVHTGAGSRSYIRTYPPS